MKLESSNRRTNAMTFTEVMVGVVVIVVLIVILLPFLAATKKGSSKIGCHQYLNFITLAFGIWEGDNGDKYPTQLDSAKGGAMELATKGVWRWFSKSCLMNYLLRNG